MIPHTPLPWMPGKRSHWSTDENLEGVTSDPSTDGNMRSLWKHEDAEAESKKEIGENPNPKYTGADGKETTPLDFMRARRRSAVEGNSASKRQGNFTAVRHPHLLPRTKILTLRPVA